MANSFEQTYVDTGFWTEYAANKSYFLVSESWASIITIAVALALWLSLLRSYRIFRTLTLFLSGKIAGGHPAHTQGIAMQNLSTSVTVAAITNQVVSEEQTPERVFARIMRDYVLVNLIQLPTTASAPRNVFHRRWVGTVTMFRENPIRTSALLMTGILYFGLAVSYQAIAIFTTRIVGHSTAHSSHPNAGAWYPDVLNPTDMVNTSIFPAVNDLQTDFMFKAVAYAGNCYREKNRKAECSLFYTPRIKYVERHNATCPFHQKMCSGGPNTSYELDTDWVDANILGINERDTCQFRMRKVCSPLIADGYVRTRSVGNVGSHFVEYQYGDGWGTIQQGNKTFDEIVPDPLRWQNDPGHYLIREIREDAIRDLQSPRQWIPELQVRGSRVSLYFVRPVNLAYTRPSADPIFPATLSPGPGMANGEPLFIYPLQRSSVFACADTYTIRHPKHHIEWQPRYQDQASLELPGWTDPNVLTSLHIVNVSHLAPSHFTSRYSDMSTHFDAPRRVRSFYSSPLDKQQWKLEVQKIFNTDLALQQFYVLGIAQGVGHDLPRAKNLLEEFDIDAKGKILFPGPGSKNIKVAELMGFLIACFACWTLAFERDDGSRGKTLWATIIWRSVSTFCIETAMPPLDKAWAKAKTVDYNRICDWLDEKLGL